MQKSKWQFNTSLQKEDPDHPSQLHRSQAISWSARKLRKSDFVIIDTETTGTKPSDQILQIGVVDAHGKQLYSQLIRPIGKRKFDEEAVEIHGITFDMVKNAPTIAEVLNDIQKTVNGRTVLAYNAEFDRRLLDQSCEKANVPTPQWKWECVMMMYSQFIGEPARKAGEYRLQKLPRKTKDQHDATADSLLTLEVLKTMASAKGHVGPLTWILGKIFDPLLELIWPD